MTRMSLKELKNGARYVAGDVEVMWEKLDEDPYYKADFERILTDVQEMLPEIERLYEKLVKGENIFDEGEPTTISYDERERFLDRLEDELFASYQVMDLWDRYQTVERLTALDMTR